VRLEIIGDNFLARIGGKKREKEKLPGVKKGALEKRRTTLICPPRSDIYYNPDFSQIGYLSKIMRRIYFCALQFETQFVSFA